MNPAELAKQFAQLLEIAWPAEPAPVLPATPPPPPCPVRLVDYAANGWHLDVTVSPEDIVASAQLLDQAGYSIDTITGVDWMAEKQMEVVYDFFYPTASWRVVLRARVNREKPEIPTIHKVFPGANWHERETHDFFGINFLGHPDLSPLLLPEDATYHPLKKDFAL
jgi:NADH-quinone oxidoreductase subunit C